MEEMVRRICWFCFVGTSLVAPLLDRAIATGGQNHAYPFSDFGCRRGLGGRAGAIRFGRGSLDAADLQRTATGLLYLDRYVGLNGGGGWGQTNHTATVNAAGLPNAEQCAAHDKGWAHYMGRLSLAAAGQDPGPDRGPHV